MAVGPGVLDRFARVLTRTAGGYLRHPIREPHVTCEVCTTPIEARFTRCYPCKQQRESGLPVADAVGFLTYATRGEQSGYLMHGYKRPRAVEEHVQVMALLCQVGIGLHGRCAERLPEASPLTHWATVPSLPPKGDAQHPLRQLVLPVAPGAEVVLRAATNPAQPRALDPSHYQAEVRVDGAHVLLVEDTWVGGGHPQSAAVALHAAGAARVSVLVIARWLATRYVPPTGSTRERLAQDYDPAICPWTGGTCP